MQPGLHSKFPNRTSPLVLYNVAHECKPSSLGSVQLPIPKLSTACCINYTNLNAFTLCSKL